MAVRAKEVLEAGGKTMEPHAPWDCQDWECKEHKNTASHSLWPPPSTGADMWEAQAMLSRHLERLWGSLFGKDRSDVGTYYSVTMRERAASRRLYRALQAMLARGEVGKV